MKLTVTTFVTLDGVYQAPGGRQEDNPEGDFAHGGWSVPYGDDEFGAFMAGVFDDVDAFLLGRVTYEIFAGYWPHVTDPDNPIASRLNSLPKYVATSTLDALEWNNSHILGADLRKEVTALKERDGRELQVHGSGKLVHSLLAMGLVDALNVLTFPVLLGTGKRLFAEGALPTAYALTSTRATGRGVVISTYDRVGLPTYGDYSMEEPA